MNAYRTRYASPLGPITIASDGTSICGLWFDGQAHFGYSVDLGSAGEDDDLLVFDGMTAWLDAYFAGENPKPSKIPLSLRGTAFQGLVWDELSKIPYGKTISYGQIAENIARKTGKRTSARVVGGAIGRNPISLIVPCHRVVGSNGNLTGYAGGLDKKIWLLEHEAKTAIVDNAS